MKTTVISILITVALIGGAILLSNNSEKSINETELGLNNVNMVGDKQIITINAKGGYSPKITNAKADVSTIIKMKTRGTFDCSSALIIPSLNYRTNLSPSGETLIDVPPQKAGSVLQGLCSMGMYNFQIKFD